jgi:hypothetical protein
LRRPLPVNPMIDFERLEAIERKWDQRFGGRETRPYRELLAYCSGRLLRAGGTLQDLVGYLSEAFDVLLEWLKDEAGDEGSDA